MPQRRISVYVLVPRLREWRLWRAFTQEDLALRAGVGRMTVIRGEAGFQIRPSSVRKLARALGVKPHDLLPRPTNGTT